MSTVPSFRPKYPTQNVTLVFNFGPGLPTGVLLTGVTLEEITPLNGRDLNAATMVVSGPTIGSTDLQLANGTVLPAGTYATLVVSGGVDGIRYYIAIQGQTAILNLEPVCAGILPVGRL